MLDTLLALRDQDSVLAQLSEDDLARIANELGEVRLAAGDGLFAAGEASDTLFLVIEGKLRVADPRPTSTLSQNPFGPGALIGEIAFATGGTHEHAVRAVEPSRLATLSRERFDGLLETSEQTWRRMHDLALARMRQARLATHIERLFGPFGPLLPYVVEELAAGIDWITLRSGESLYQAGDQSEHAYILMTGRLVVARDVPGRAEEPISTVVEGETVGEVGLLTEEPRSATVYAARDSELARLSRNSFQLMLERNSKAMMKIARILAQRLASKRHQLDAAQLPIRCLSLIPATPSSPVAHIASALSRRLEEKGNVKHLSSQRIDEELGMPRISHAKEGQAAFLRLIQWLHEQESAHRYLVFEADPSWSPWNDLCARQADQVVVVADATDEPNLSSIAGKISGPRRSWSLILVHPADTDRPRNTSRWLADVDAHCVYHVRSGNDEDLARLARILSGRAIGLVLGGGGARGYAHLGVLRAFEELGVPIDMVGGTSIGAPIAALTAGNYTPSDVYELIERDFRRLLDYTPPIGSLLTGHRITEVIYRHAGTWEIEDLWRPYFCMSTSLTTSQPIVHRRGNLARAVRASVAIPGVLLPVPHDGHILVDGGVLNNLPIDVMRELNPFGSVVAIDVVAPEGRRATHDYPLAVSGWRLALNKVSPWRRTTTVPSIAGTILRSTVVGATLARDRMLAEGLADLYHNIHVPGISMLQFDRVDEAAQCGYESAIGPLRAWAQSGALD